MARKPGISNNAQASVQQTIEKLRSLPDLPIQELQDTTMEPVQEVGSAPPPVDWRSRIPSQSDTDPDEQLAGLMERRRGDPTQMGNEETVATAGEAGSGLVQSALDAQSEADPNSQPSLVQNYMDTGMEMRGAANRASMPNPVTGQVIPGSESSPLYTELKGKTDEEMVTILENKLANSDHMTRVFQIPEILGASDAPSSLSVRPSSSDSVNYANFNEFKAFNDGMVKAAEGSGFTGELNLTQSDMAASLSVPATNLEQQFNKAVKSGKFTGSFGEFKATKESEGQVDHDMVMTSNLFWKLGGVSLQIDPTGVSRPGINTRILQLMNFNGFHALLEMGSGNRDSIYDDNAESMFDSEGNEVQDETGAPPSEINTTTNAALVGRTIADQMNDINLREVGESYSPVKLSNEEAVYLGEKSLKMAAFAFPDVIRYFGLEQIAASKGISVAEAKRSGFRASFQFKPNLRGVALETRDMRNMMLGKAPKPPRFSLEIEPKNYLKTTGARNSFRHTKMSADSAKVQSQIQFKLESFGSKIVMMGQSALRDPEALPDKADAALFGFGEKAALDLKSEHRMKEDIPNDNGNPIAVWELEYEKMLNKKTVDLINFTKLIGGVDLKGNVFKGAPWSVDILTWNYNGRKGMSADYGNVQANKILRYAVTSPHMTTVKAGSQNESNLIQMLSKDLIKEAGAALPRERNRLWKINQRDIEETGRILDGFVNDKMTDEQAYAYAGAVQGGGIAVDDPNAPKIPALGLSQLKGMIPDAHYKLITEKYEGIRAMLGFVEAHKWAESKRKGDDFQTNYVSGVDGKTHGFASLTAMLGLKDMALRVGLLRSQDFRYLDEDTDIRDAIINGAVDSFEVNSVEGSAFSDPVLKEHMTTVMKKLFSHKPMVKQMVMTFVYGREIGAFRNIWPDELDQLLTTRADTLTDAELNSARVIQSRVDPKIFADTTHNYFVQHGLLPNIDSTMLEFRASMKVMAGLAALLDVPFHYSGPNGEVLSASSPTLDYDTPSMSFKNKIPKADGGSMDSVTSVRAFKDSSIKEKVLGDGTVILGASAINTSVVQPVQSTDAFMMDWLFGNKWKDLEAKRGDKAWAYQIFDSVQTDVANWQDVTNSVNEGFIEASKVNPLESARETFRSLEKMVEDMRRLVSKGEVKLTDELPVGMQAMLKQSVQEKAPMGKQIPLETMMNASKELLSERVLSKGSEDRVKYVKDLLQQLGLVTKDQYNYGDFLNYYDIIYKHVFDVSKINKIINRTNQDSHSLRKEIMESWNHDGYLVGNMYET